MKQTVITPQDFEKYMTIENYIAFIESIKKRNKISSDVKYLWIIAEWSE